MRLHSMDACSRMSTFLSDFRKGSIWLLDADLFWNINSWPAKNRSKVMILTGLKRLLSTS